MSWAAYIFLTGWFSLGFTYGFRRGYIFEIPIYLVANLIAIALIFLLTSLHPTSLMAFMVVFFFAVLPVAVLLIVLYSGWFCGVLTKKLNSH